MLPGDVPGSFLWARKGGTDRAPIFEFMFLRKIENFIADGGLICPGERILIALSGGADSVCLLRVLCTLREKEQLTLMAVHVQHGIRGETAQADAAFCETLCRTLDVPFRRIDADIPALAAATDRSVEEAGRTFRYATFEELRAAEGFDRIAVAHHADDNAETMLLNLCRGTGVAGLCGMAPVSGRLIRPLLCVYRDEIEDYLRRIGQPWRTDETNEDLSYARNRIRQQVLPQMKQINPQASAHLNRTAQILRETEEYLARQVRDAQMQCLQTVRAADGDGQTVDINLKVFRSFDPLIRKRILLGAMEQVCGCRKDLAAVHAEALEDLTELPSGRRIDLPYGMRAQRIYDTLRITVSSGENAPDPGPADVFDPAALVPGASGRVCCNGLRLVFSCLDAEDVDFAALVSEKTCTKYVDCDKIKGRLTVRGVRTGDTVAIDAAGHRKAVRRVLIDEKVPLPERGNVTVAADGDRIVWMSTGRIGYEYRLTAETKRILEIRTELSEGEPK